MREMTIRERVVIRDIASTKIFELLGAERGATSLLSDRNALAVDISGPTFHDVQRDATLAHLDAADVIDVCHEAAIEYIESSNPMKPALDAATNTWRVLVTKVAFPQISRSAPGPIREAIRQYAMTISHASGGAWPRRQWPDEETIRARQEAAQSAETDDRG
jgi:hypothetical protein